MSFNPANFPWTMPTIRVERDRGTTYGNQGDEPTNPLLAVAGDLKAAAVRFDARRDDFARGKGDTCRDIAAKLERFGSFASEKQAEFARKLIEWSVPRWERQDDRTPLRTLDPVEQRPTREAVAAAQPAPVLLPRLFDLMQRLAKLEIKAIKLARKNQDSLVWIKHAAVDGVVGKLENGVLVIFHGRIAGRISAQELRNALLAIEADPEAAAVLHGKASGRCAVCSRDLTDPESIARGIGPICAEKF